MAPALNTQWLHTQTFWIRFIFIIFTNWYSFPFVQLIVDQCLQNSKKKWFTTSAVLFRTFFPDWILTGVFLEFINLSLAVAELCDMKVSRRGGASGEIVHGSWENSAVLKPQWWICPLYVEALDVWELSWLTHLSTKPRAAIGVQVLGGLEYKQNTCWWSDSACLYCKCHIVVFYWQGSLCPSPSPLSSPRSPSLLSITPYHSVRFVCQDNIRNSKNHSAGRSKTGMSAFRSWVSSSASENKSVSRRKRHWESFLFSLAKDNVPDWDIWKKTVC